MLLTSPVSSSTLDGLGTLKRRCCSAPSQLLVGRVYRLQVLHSYHKKCTAATKTAGSIVLSIIVLSRPIPIGQILSDIS